MTDVHDKADQEVWDAQAKLREALERKATIDAGPREIKRSDQATINANVRAIAAGTAVIVDDVHPRRELRANEIANDDFAGMNANVADIASGRRVVVSPYE